MSYHSLTKKNKGKSFDMLIGLKNFAAGCLEVYTLYRKKKRMPPPLAKECSTEQEFLFTLELATRELVKEPLDHLNSSVSKFFIFIFIVDFGDDSQKSRSL